MGPKQSKDNEPLGQQRQQKKLLKEGKSFESGKPSDVTRQHWQRAKLPVAAISLSLLLFAKKPSSWSASSRVKSFCFSRHDQLVIFSRSPLFFLSELLRYSPAPFPCLTYFWGRFIRTTRTGSKWRWTRVSGRVVVGGTHRTVLLFVLLCSLWVS
jgi:hypothetical protein